MLKDELETAKEAAQRAPSKTMKHLVERLRNQLALKEKQQKVDIKCRGYTTIVLQNSSFVYTYHNSFINYACVGLADILDCVALLDMLYYDVFRSLCSP